MARSAPPSDDGSPARLIATMLGIVGILLLGSLAWSAVGALASAVGAAGSALSAAANPPPVATLQPVVAVTATTVDVVTENTLTPVVGPTGTIGPTAQTGRTPTVLATAVPRLIATVPADTPTPVAASGRNPWILLPQPEPGATVQSGSLTVEARGRGDAPITSMRIELDGAALPVSLEQRSESTWRGFASTKVSAGAHSVRATVTDASGRTGSFRWSFTAG